MTEELLAKTFTLRKSDVDIIQTQSKELDSLSDSATLRQILREWVAFKAAQIPLDLPGMTARES